MDDNCPYCLMIAKKKEEEKARLVIIKCRNCGTGRVQANIPSGDLERIIQIDPFCSRCEEKEEEKKFDRDMGVVDPAQIECAACGRLNMPPNNLGVVIGPGLTYFCACGARLKLTKKRKQNVWETEVFEVEKVTPAKGSWIEVTDSKQNDGYDTRLAIGDRSEKTEQVRAKSCASAAKVCWKYWRYVGEKEWRK